MSIGESISQTVKARESQAQAILDAEIGPLAVKWRKYGQKGLELFHESGALLNRSLGDPDKRLSYGGKILLNTANRLGISQSELSRMRWFARLFTSVAEFHQQRPDLNTWTAFKKALPILKVQPAQQETHTSKKPTASAKLAAVAKSVAGINKKLSQIENLADDDLLKPLTNLGEQVKTLAERLSMSVTV